jgi:hypothetical protein
VWEFSEVIDLTNVTGADTPLRLWSGEESDESGPSQWGICFKWQEGDAWNVEVTDYHRGVNYQAAGVGLRPARRKRAQKYAVLFAGSDKDCCFSIESSAV